MKTLNDIANSTTSAECESIAARLDSLESRVANLRRINRSLVVALCAIGTLATVGLTTTATRSPEVLRAKRIQMVDDNERVRAELGIDEQGSAGLFVLDGGGLIRATLVHDEVQTAMYLMDEAGVVRLGAAQFSHGGGGIAMHGPELKGAAVLMLKDSIGSLTFYDKDGEVVLRTPDSGTPSTQKTATPSSQAD